MMKKYEQDVTQLTDFNHLVRLNPFDGVVLLKKVNTQAFEVMDFNDKLPLLIELHDVQALSAEQFFTEPCWQQLVSMLQQEIMTVEQYMVMRAAPQEKIFAVSIQHLEQSMIAIILREKQQEVTPLLQFVEQHVTPVLTIDLQGKIIYQNHTATALLAKEQQCLIGLDIFSLIEEDYLNEFRLVFDKTIEGMAFGMQNCLFKHQLLSADPFYLKAQPTYFQNVIVGIHLFIKEANAFGNDSDMSYSLALVDEVTGLWNRKAFKEHWQLYTTQKTSHSKQTSLVLIDIDRFKKFNESLGESRGDELMRMFGQRLRKLCCAHCSAYRYNSDEFILLVKNEDVEMIDDVVTAIFDMLKEPFMIDGQEYFISVSIGIANSPTDGYDLETLVRKADQALFTVKEHGRSHHRYYREEMRHAFPNEALMEAHLRRAIEFNELSIHLQPQMDLTNNRIDSFEALLRWNNRKFGFVTPAQFIPIAEASGLIVEIGDWIIDEVCRYQQEWRMKGYRPVRIAVNISPTQFRKEDFANKIKASLEKYNVLPGLLEVEITESSMTNVHETISILSELKQLGVYVSVDDFGTGYSSLSYLKRYPIDIIKIDQSFIADIEKDDKNEAIIKAIISMSHNLGLEVVAEGIEDLSQADFLKRYQCQKGQGYLYNKPLPVDTIVEQYFLN
ncbi:sensor domain-containing protein [Lysinibacillus piscis]|uniref:GGDEF domain-containing protein n=1 Tax=Lysinibacillus piscis TaxID=2518931 RepID=A0ABQ5NHT8_9BACI|nr:bifunctional diguanylate cyclase/phosphodiesterase [Lysinibacillus sp. KH24]GLC87663.1 GGDEF domain-containing protein [Lysinibacillus sp. KH24]